LAVVALPARAQLLKMGPIDLGLTLNSSFNYTTNYDGLPDGEDPANGEEREDAYLVYGFTLQGETKVWPDIDLRLSVSLNKELHFIRDEAVEDSFPFLGSSSFNLTRPLGRYTFTVGLSHNATAEYDKEEVFRPSGRRRSRDITQTSTANLGATWTYTKLRLNTNYTYTRERHSSDFEDGDNDSQNFNAVGTYEIHPRLKARTNYQRTRQDQINVENDPASGIWEETIFLGFDIDILKRPSLRYSVGGEREDEGPEEGEWEPVHTVSFNDTRQLFPTLSLSLNANYNFEREQESDDITFTYGATLTHQMPFRFQQSLSATREPVSTFGSTQETDSSTLTYTLTHPSFFIQRLQMNYSATYSEDSPTGPTPAPDETSLTHAFSLSRPFQISRKWTSSLAYTFNLEDREVGAAPPIDETITEHRGVLTLTYTVF
jgi:hypothetical protein